MGKNRLQFNIAIGDEDHKVIKELQERFSVNVSHFLKSALRQRLEELRNTKPRK